LLDPIGSSADDGNERGIGVGDAALETYLAGVEPAAVRVVVALDAAVRAASPDLDVAVKYRMLMYALGGDWRHWVVSIDAHPKDAIGLRFLYGVLLEDDLAVLRPGSSTLETWDFGRTDEVDADAVGRYVREAVSKYGDFKANQAELAAQAKAAGGTRRTRNAEG
jgi:hypothetical protein